MSITGSHNQTSSKGILHVVEACVGGENLLWELYDGYRYVPAFDIDASCTKEAAVVKLRTVVRYLDYLPGINAAVTERHPVEGAINPARDRLEDSAILEMAWDILLALAYLHGRGIVHGEVRPRNVMCFPSYPRRNRHKLFGHGLVPGVINYWPKNDGYTAPEFLSEGAGTRKRSKGGKHAVKPTFASDVWQLGMLLWHCHRYGTYWDSETLPSRKKSWQSETLVRPDLTSESVSSMRGIRPLAFRAKGCDGSSHDWLAQLLPNMLDEDPLRRFSAMELLRQMQNQKSYAVEKQDLEDDVEDMKDAAEAAKKELWQRSTLGKVARGAERVQKHFSRLLFLLVLLCRIM
ncbi:Serine/threonine-protein kinase RUNKEL [Colletotrichum shisoi]|uniref:Serine/threonine-protein kinase RUNKEL n=1 Tax=Colletotrichum shisoi TaxID=2078593 RepID=A0A5Q4C569_9PEZI|nr:Serine/threonine-protein kinase RUNKEL [Colletotrichum shisoi]